MVPIGDGTELADRVRGLREQNGLSQPELAKRIGIAQASLSLIESGRTKTLKASTLMRLSKELHVDPQDIINAPTRMTGLTEQEGDALTMLRRMRPDVRDTWMGIGELLLRRAKPPRERQR